MADSDPSADPPLPPRHPVAAWIFGLLCLAAAGFGALLWQRIFQPDAWMASAPPAFQFDRSPMATALAPDRVRIRQAAIESFGSRFIGQTGVVATAAYMRYAFEAAGLEILEHDVLTPAPVTQFREIARVDPAGPIIPLNLSIYPFFPNHLQPITTGDAGVTGTLLLLTPELLKQHRDFSNVIGLIDAKEGAYDPDYGFSWVRYARLGLKALIVSHSDGLQDVPWHRVNDQNNGMVSSVSLNFVRLAADPAIFQHLGQTLRLRVKVQFENVPNTIYYGVLRAPQPAREAVLFTAPFDAPSVLPDSAPGSLAAIAPALQLQLLQGLLPYRNSLRRDVIFVAYGSGTMADDAIGHLARLLQLNTKKDKENPLLRALGLKEAQPENQRLAHIRKHAESNVARRAPVESIAATLENPAFFADPAATDSAIRQFPTATRAFFEDQFAYVLQTIVYELNEPQLQAKLAFERRPEQGVQSEAFKAYLKAKRRYDEATNLAGYSPLNLLTSQPDFVRTYNVRARLVDRFAELAAFHAHTARRLEQEHAITALFDGYRDFAAFHARLVPAAATNAAPTPESVTLDTAFQRDGPRISNINALFSRVASALRNEHPAFDFRPLTREAGDLVGQMVNPAPTQITQILDNWGYASYTLFSVGRQSAFTHYGSPVTLPFMRNLDSLEASFAYLGQSMLALVHGDGLLTPSPAHEWQYFSYGGRVLAANIGQALVPSYPLKGATVACRSQDGAEVFSRVGFYAHPFAITDPYGEFLVEFSANDFAVWWRVYAKALQFFPVVAKHGADGLIHYIKDEGDDAQRLFKSRGVGIGNAAHLTYVTFRAAPLAILDLTNPQTMQDYSGTQMLRADGLSTFRRQFPYVEGRGLRVTYLEPDQRAYVVLQSGTPDNELVKVPRAFLLGVDSPHGGDPSKDISGPGYLVADVPILHGVATEAARSMAMVNGRRLALQTNFHMADRQTLEYQDRTLAFLKASQKPDLPHQDQLSLARDSVTYATLNHPVIRESVLEAVLGIIWYLGLLVPFVFFFEKLVFCYSDVRKQLAAQAVIFLVVFTLLRLLHPAFEMVRSSIMILLGFVIILISGGITLLFSGKFQENLEEIRKRQGKVTGAEVNTLGVLGSAFMLGLNNMHRRKVRTGLTCATLTLLTFVMISFTSTQNEISEEDTAIGRAPYQGILVKKELFEPLSDAEVFAFVSKYGEAFDVCVRRLYTGIENWSDKRRYNPEFDAAATSPAGPRTFQFDSILELSDSEPLQNELQFLTQRRWFSEEEADAEPAPILLPDTAANSLGISPDAVDAGSVVITVNGRPFRVHAIFTAASLDALSDLDGLGLRPFDIEQMTDLSQTVSGYIIAEDTDPRILASKLAIVPQRDLFQNVPNGSRINHSLVVHMPDAGYREASQRIEQFMEQTAEPVFYGLDGIAFKGKRTRETTLAGLIDLLIPLLIAGLTVLNTMKGSVYERRDEIYVYNAVGIAPRYVFFMFIAEALVYAVVGSILGYLLSQGTGRILTELNLTGGLNMTYTSLTTIYASLTIAAAVLVSTYFPAKQAMEIATPAEEAGWALPEPDGDELAFDLPFNFRPRGRLAVLAFFNRYLLDHAEGSAGRFFAATPQMGISDLTDQDYVPTISTTIWLKPFDLAVSQRMTISMPVDPETGQFKAHIALRRLTGTRESWLRLNHGFVSQVRRHFLHWRAVTPDEREALFDEARQKFERDLGVPLQPSAQPA